MSRNLFARFANEFCCRFAFPVRVPRWTVICILASPLFVGARQSMAQSQPATIPIVVAQAMAFEPSFLGRPQFFDQTPPNWPAALTPPAVKVIGGGIVGDSTMFRMRVAVFEFSSQSNPRAVMEGVVARAGYGNPPSEPPHSRFGGFAETATPAPAGKYCKGSTLAMFGAVDSARAPLVFAVYVLDGEAGRQTCNPRANELNPGRYPVTVPSLSPPAGVMSIGGGSSWSGSSGQMSSTVRTTMPTDSLLAHYSAQLVAGGWKSEGRPGNTDGVGVQRFTFRDGQDPWTCVLIVIAVGDRREVQLNVSRSD
jgi:hypothetical protein